MGATITCDGCGKQAPMSIGQDSSYHKPHSWFQRTVFEHDGAGLGEPKGRVVELLTVCSRECIDTLDAKRKADGKPSHAMVLPI